MQWAGHAPSSISELQLLSRPSQSSLAEDEHVAPPLDAPAFVAPAFAEPPLEVPPSADPPLAAPPFRAPALAEPALDGAPPPAFALPPLAEPALEGAPLTLLVPPSFAGLPALELGAPAVFGGAPPCALPPLDTTPITPPAVLPTVAPPAGAPPAGAPPDAVPKAPAGLFSLPALADKPPPLNKESTPLLPHASGSRSNGATSEARAAIDRLPGIRASVKPTLEVRNARTSRVARR